ncbi:MAG: hypothetical protein N2111_05395 [Candidatus Sumerlaeaceae bacterium]|nr:hypothetical protein [Candidatus Sumerlaeaceae bacterium]
MLPECGPDKWRVSLSGNALSLPGTTATVEAESTIKDEGAGSLKFTFTYPETLWYEVAASKTFSTPVDLSQARRFTMKLRGDANSANCLWFLSFVSANGHVFRYVEWGALPNGSWRTAQFNLTDMAWDTWVQNGLDQPELNKVSKIELHLQRNGNAATTATTVVYVDDLQAYNDAGDMLVIPIDEFEYADDAALQAAWTVSAGNGNSLSLVTTTSAFQGAKAMQMNIGQVAANFRLNAIKTLPVPVDMSGYDFFRISVKGDPVIPPASAPVLFLSLEDTNINRSRGWMQSALRGAGYTTYLMYNQLTAPNSAPMQEDPWDAGGNVDLTQIKKILVYLQETVGGTYNASLAIDALEYGIVAPPSAAGKDWSLYE